MVLSGKVVLRDLDQELSANEVRYLREPDRVRAAGEVRYRTEDLYLEAERAEIDLASETGSLDAVAYRLREGGGRGTSGRVFLEGKDRSTLQAVSFTTCPLSDSPDWQLQAREMTLDQGAGKGTGRGMELRFKGVPLLYLPYATFPIDDRRKSGFLYPSLGSSNDDGLDVAIPYYWNIAPQMDATLTPRLITDRGAMLGVEYRYLLADASGELAAEYLPDDDRTGRHRAFAGYRHAGWLSERLRLDLELSHVSDVSYFEDFGNSLSALSRSYLRSNAALTALGDWWQASLSADAFEIVDRNVAGDAEPFDRLPRLRFSGRRAVGAGLEFSLDAEAVAFERDFGIEGTRVDLVPRIGYPFYRPAFYLEPQLALRHTAYDLDRADDDSPDRTTALASVVGGLFFDRRLPDGGQQTLEPRFHYLYVPFEDQTTLPVFDSRELTFDFGQLFRSNRFSGADRQADANQLALAVTTRVSGGDGREWLEASVGAIVHFRDQRVQLAGRRAADAATSPLVAELHYRPSDLWRASLGFQFDPDDGDFDRTVVAVQNRAPSGRLLNLAYRRRGNLVRQVDASFLAPLSERWSLVGRANYSFLADTELETLIGFEYDSCCWALRGFFRRYLRNQRGEKRNGLYLELELKGLGSLGRRTDQLLQRAILGQRSIDYRGL